MVHNPDAFQKIQDLYGTDQTVAVETTAVEVDDHVEGTDKDSSYEADATFQDKSVV